METSTNKILINQLINELDNKYLLYKKKHNNY